MANKRTTKKNAKKETTKISTAAPVIEKAAVVEEVKAEPAPAVTEAIPPVVEAPVVTKAPAAEPVKEKKGAPKKKATPAKSEGVKKDDVFVLQSNGKDYTISDITELCKAAYKNGTRKHIKSCDVYVKSENDNLRAYYVINGNADGAYIDL